MSYNRPKGRLNKEKAAEILVDAYLESPQKASEIHGVHVRTIQNYQKKMQEDIELSAMFQYKRKLAEREWMSSVAPAIRKGVKFIERAAQTADATNPQVIETMVTAMRMLAELEMTSKVLDVRFAEQNREKSQEDRGVVTAQTYQIPEWLASN